MPYRAATQAPIAGHIWVIVLAGGSGKRLSSLTSDAHGNAVPKQFCSLDGAQSLIEKTLIRATTIVAAERIMAVVTASHSQYWVPALRDLPADNIIVQPEDRGTAIGILLPALRIRARDPDARILLLPSDHHVANEGVLEHAMRCALEDIGAHDVGVALLGIEADEPDPELGYIVPRAGRHPRLHDVQRFIEKPPTEEARRLVSEGALWNSFIVASRVESLIALLIHACPQVVSVLQEVEGGDFASLLQCYRVLPTVDFSRDIVSGQEHRVAVMPVGSCGWSDLGTPHRVAKTLARQPRGCVVDTAMVGVPQPSGWVDLAQRLAQLYPALLAEG